MFQHLYFKRNGEKINLAHPDIAEFLGNSGVGSAAGLLGDGLHFVQTGYIPIGESLCRQVGSILPALLNAKNREENKILESLNETRRITMPMSQNNERAFVEWKARETRWLMSEQPQSDLVFAFNFLKNDAIQRSHRTIA